MSKQIDLEFWDRAAAFKVELLELENAAMELEDQRDILPYHVFTARKVDLAQKSQAAIDKQRQFEDEWRLKWGDK